MSAAAEIQAVANTLADALVFLRSVEKTSDYFSGHSLLETMQEHVTDIGDPDMMSNAPNTYDDLPDVPVGGGTPRLTHLAKLNSLRIRLLGEDGMSGAIGTALDILASAGDTGVDFRRRQSEEEE
jgi:hypothetical protein